MIAACDPQKTYFVLGRATKETADGKNSVSNIIDEEIRKHNMDHPMNKFAVLGRYAGASKFPTGDLAETISWIQDIEQGRDDVPRSMVEFVKKNKGLVVALAGSEFDAAPVIAAIVRDVKVGVDTAVIAAKFHNAVADLIVRLSVQMRAQHGLNTVALSGGVFQNVVVLETAVTQLQQHGFSVLTHHLVPPNDGGLALGQVMVGANTEV